MNFTPVLIKELKVNQIFCFGSNLAGRHGAGAAKIAKEKFGAIYGVGKGLTGQCYAFPTKDLYIDTLPLSRIRQEFEDLIVCCNRNQDKEFLLTEVGCGLAGYNPKEIAGLLIGIKLPENLLIPETFYNELNKPKP